MSVVGCSFVLCFPQEILKVLLHLERKQNIVVFSINKCFHFRFITDLVSAVYFLVSVKTIQLIKKVSERDKDIQFFSRLIISRWFHLNFEYHFK